MKEAPSQRVGNDVSDSPGKTSPTAIFPEIVDSFPLSPMQQGMLFHSLYAPRSGVYIKQIVCTLREPLDFKTFEEAWRRVFARHGAIRTAFRWQDLAQPQQDEYAHVDVPWNEVDWQNYSESDQNRRLTEFLDHDRRDGFKLDAVPLQRLALIRCGRADFRFIWTHHHGLLDGWSCLLVIKEVFRLYDALCANENLSLPELPHFRKYIEWFEQQDSAQAERYWRDSFAGFDLPTEMATKVVRPELPAGENCQQLQAKLSRAATDRLRHFARQHSVTPGTIVQGAWALLVSRYTGRDDIVFGTTRAGRQGSFDGAQQMVGLFINTLPIRVRVRADTEVLAWLQEMRNQAVAMRPFEHTSLVKVQEWSGVAGNKSLFDSLFVFDNQLFDSAVNQGAQDAGKRHFDSLGTTNYPLTITGFLEPELILGIEYDRRFFDDETTARMMDHFQTLVENLIANADQKLADVVMLTAAEKQQLLIEWNDTSRDFPTNGCVHDLFAQQAERTPGALAVVCEEFRLTYRELNQRANQLAQYLVKLGVAPETRVGICMDRSLNLMIGLLGIMKAGGAYVPLDPDYPKDRLEFMLNDAQCPVLLTQAHLKERLPNYAGNTILVDADWGEVARQNDVSPAVKIDGENLAYVIFTSGSTGNPKGAMIRHGGLTNYLNHCLDAYPIQEGRGSLVHSSIAFDATITGLYAPLLAGRTVYMQPRTDDLEALANTLRRVRDFSVVKITPAHLAMLSQQIPPQEAAGLTRCFVIGGENLVSDQIAFWQQHAPQTLLFNEYGPTETVVGCIVYEASQWRGSGSVLIGKPIANTSVYALDHHSQPVPVGIVGELHIGGAGVARGYLNRAELTSERFIVNRHGDDEHARLYRTGDLVRYRPDGNLEFIGRIDNQVKIRGYRIELGEIEAALSQHPAVQSAAVLAREDTPGDKRLVAYVTLIEGAAENPQELRNFLREKLPDYMVPAAQIVLREMPLTSNGKIDRKALPEPTQASVAPAAAFIGPRNEIEETLGRIWQEVLNVAQVGMRDNFFELGGHSLLAVRVYARLREEFSIDLPVVTLFRHPTIEELALPIADAQRNRYSAHVNGSSGWKYLREFQPGKGKIPVYMIPGGIGGEVDVELFFYARLAHFVGADYPFYGLRPKGADGHEDPHLSVSAMAKDFLAEIRVHQPKGPYFLTGACIGGAVAYEMACRLEAMGEQVAFLGLLDTVCPNFRDYLKYRLQSLLERYRSTRREWTENYYVRRVGHHWRVVKQMRWDESLAYLGGRGAAALADIERGVTAGVEDASVADAAPLHAAVQAFQQTYEGALRRYRPRRYRGKITLLNAEAVAAEYGKAAGWESRVAGTIEEHVLPGNHLTLFRQDVKILAAQLRDCLDRAVATAIPRQGRT